MLYLFLFSRREILEGLLVAALNIDIVVNTIRNAKDGAAAKSGLMFLPWENIFLNSTQELGYTELESQFYFSERQAKSILEMRLQRLTGLEKDKIRAELKHVLQKIEYYNSILSSEKELLHVLKQEFLDIKSTFASPRLTKISDQGIEHVGYESMIAEEEGM